MQSLVWSGALAHSQEAGVDFELSQKELNIGVPQQAMH